MVLSADRAYAVALSADIMIIMMMIVMINEKS
jgi:hypothetical protein